MRSLVICLALPLAGCFLFRDGQDDTGDSGDTSGPDDPCPSMTVDLTGLTFGDVAVGHDQTLQIRVGNDCVGEEFLIVEGVISGDPAFSLPDRSIAVAPGTQTSMAVTYDPFAIGSFSATLKLNANGVPPAVVGLSGSSTTSLDLDGDGYIGVDSGGTDCDDTDPAINPGVRDICYDGVDADCDGSGDWDCDGDGYKSAAHGGDDCEDDEPSAHPGQVEVRDLVDQDCDGLVDEDFVTWGDMIITEAMVSPSAVSAQRGQWIEVKNRSAYTIDLIGWKVSMTSPTASHTITEHLVVAPGGHAVLGVDSRTGSNGGVRVDYQYSYSALPMTDGSRLKLSLLGASIISAPVHQVSGVSGASYALDGRVASPYDAIDPASWCTENSALSAGDLGSPGATNRNCPTIIDLDGDGYQESDGDCDDGDASVHPGATEVWGDFIDNDCDGTADTNDIDSIYTSTVDGKTRGGYVDQLGFFNAMGIGDIDGDGYNELVLGSYYANEYVGGAYVLPLEDYASWSGDADSVDDARVTGADTYNYLGNVGSTQADNDGDGQADLFLAGHDYWGTSSGNVAGALFSAPSGLVDPSDAELTLNDGESNADAVANSHTDLDGDGVAELILGEGRNNVSSFAGRVSIIDADGLSGSMSLDDADSILTGPNTYDYLGQAVTGGDLDGDGYDDLVLSAGGDDTAYAEAGAAYIVFGGSSYPTSGDVDTVADAVLLGPRKGANFAKGPESGIGDFDASGDVDLAVPCYEDGEVYVYLDAGSLSGSISATSADATLENSGSPTMFGVGLAVGDYDGDGVDDIAVGAADDDTELPGSHATVKGVVYLFLGADLGAGAHTEADAGAAITGMSSSDAFGQALLAHDLDGDGQDDLIINANGYSSNEGRVYFWLTP